MSTNDTWMPLYIGDYLADTMHLSAEEHGAYMLLIMHYWRNGAIKNDKNSIKNIAKISTKKAEKILDFFELKDGYFFHKRIEDELRKSLENKEKQKKKTEAATAARWKKEDKTESVTDSVTDILTESPSPSPYLLTTFVSNTDDDCSAGEKVGKKIKEKEIYSFLENLFSPGTPFPSAPILAWGNWESPPDFELDIKPVAERYKAIHPGKPPRSLSWLDEDLVKSIKQRNKPMPEMQEMQRHESDKPIGQRKLSAHDNFVLGANEWIASKGIN